MVFLQEQKYITGPLTWKDTTNPNSTTKLIGVVSMGGSVKYIYPGLFDPKNPGSLFKNVTNRK